MLSPYLCFLLRQRWGYATDTVYIHLYCTIKW